ncbi:hypothetical protein SSX86_025601 [Deinandra increscens subsp. villosa]|uniref:eRF1/Pelota-like N-terminal domain-containing protein n=1 Tax=Deinandra increscens subsp. villosa TaxID=3103831 RepID=A0AAP0GLJ4_9ASTR
MTKGQGTDRNIKIWRLKKLITTLEAARSNHTNLISLIISPHEPSTGVIRMLHDDFETASCIKRTVDHLPVLAAIASAGQRLRRYYMVPPNGLVIYTGTVAAGEGKVKKVVIDFEPFKPINASLYHRGDRFHTESLVELLESEDDVFGFIVMDGNETLFGTLRGDTREVSHKFTFFINSTTSKPNVSGLIIAGSSAGFRTELSQSDMFDPRLRAKILNVVDVSYGGENGFNQAIELSSEVIANVKFNHEKRLLRKFSKGLVEENEKYVFGVDDTLKCLEVGAVETLIVWENLDINRWVLKNSTTGEIIVKHLNKDEEGDQRNFRDSDTNAVLEAQEKKSLLEWLADEYKIFGCTIEFVTDKSHEGSKFCKDSLGIGAILRYQLHLGTC